MSAQAATSPERISDAGAVEQARKAGDEKFDPRSLNAGRRSPVVYAGGGDYKVTKGDKIIGAVLLGYLIFAVYAIVTNDGP